MRRQQRTEFRDRRRQIAGVAILHCQTVTRETVARVLLHHVLQDFQPGACHVLCYYTSEMACPHFHAVKPRSQTDNSNTAMLPLGDAWEGTCRAVPESPWNPDEITLRSWCNLGYARGACAHFPADEGPDAVRFTIMGDDAGSLRLYYVLERDHHPFAHGPLEFSRAGEVFVEAPAHEAARRLARAYVASYLRRKMEASGG